MEQSRVAKSRADYETKIASLNREVAGLRNERRGPARLLRRKEDDLSERNGRIQELEILLAEQGARIAELDQQSAGSHDAMARELREALGQRDARLEEQQRYTTNLQDQLARLQTLVGNVQGSVPEDCEFDGADGVEGTLNPLAKHAQLQNEVQLQQLRLRAAAEEAADSSADPEMLCLVEVARIQEQLDCVILERDTLRDSLEAPGDGMQSELEERLLSATDALSNTHDMLRCASQERDEALASNERLRLRLAHEDDKSRTPGWQLEDDPTDGRQVLLDAAYKERDDATMQVNELLDQLADEQDELLAVKDELELLQETCMKLVVERDDAVKNLQDLQDLQARLHDGGKQEPSTSDAPARSQDFQNHTTGALLQELETERSQMPIHGHKVDDLPTGLETRWELSIKVASLAASERSALQAKDLAESERDTAAANASELSEMLAHRSRVMHAKDMELEALKSRLEEAPSADLFFQSTRQLESVQLERDVAVSEARALAKRLAEQEALMAMHIEQPEQVVQELQQDRCAAKAVNGLRTACSMEQVTIERLCAERDALEQKFRELQSSVDDRISTVEKSALAVCDKAMRERDQAAACAQQWLDRLTQQEAVQEQQLPHLQLDWSERTSPNAVTGARERDHPETVSDHAVLARDRAVDHCHDANPASISLLPVTVLVSSPSARSGTVLKERCKELADAVSHMRQNMRPDASGAAPTEANGTTLRSIVSESDFSMAAVSPTTQAKFEVVKLSGYSCIVPAGTAGSHLESLTTSDFGGSLRVPARGCAVTPVRRSLSPTARAGTRPLSPTTQAGTRPLSPTARAGTPTSFASPSLRNWRGASPLDRFRPSCALDSHWTAPGVKVYGHWTPQAPSSPAQSLLRPQASAGSVRVFPGARCVTTPQRRR